MSTKFNTHNFLKMKGYILDDILIRGLGRMKKTDFTRKRSVLASDILLYNLNNRHKTNKIELYDFINNFDKNKVSTPGFYKQRLKLDPFLFKVLNEELITDFYKLFPNEVKSIKGKYILCGIDGSDCEIPNTKETRERYKAENTTDNDRVARIKLSNCYDLLNKRILDTEIERYKYSERELALKHIEVSNRITSNFINISVMDRGYFSIGFIYELINNNDLFLVRLSSYDLKMEKEKMKTNDEIVEIEYEYNRIRYYIEKNKDLYNFYENGNTIQVRLTNIELPTGEIETLASNLPMDEFSSNDLNEYYQNRWGSETNYHELKESCQITNISSEKPIIIEQEIFSEIMVYNVLEAIAAEANECIDQEKYKHKMKINFNMAIGLLKRWLVMIIIEPDKKKASEMYDNLQHEFLENIIPIRPNRHYSRKGNKKNKHSINKRKSF